MRLRTFELVANEIDRQGIKGNVAECGVFRGDFAKLINARFPDRELYLFDTFEGFEQENLQKAVQNGECDKSFLAIDFSKTSVDYVLNRMLYKEKCIIRQGLFPETIQEKEKDDSFAFVSLDTDLEESIYRGLEFFWPRLENGGYIFLHDYNSINLIGAKRAIERYEQKHKLNIVPISDRSGTLIIVK